MAIDKTTYAASKKYTDTTVAGGGAIKGKNCTVDSITDITGGHRVTFKWTLDNGTVQTGTMDVMDGADGQDGADGHDGLTPVITVTEITGGHRVAIQVGSATPETFDVMDGEKGEDGDPGPGVPEGGTRHQVLRKVDGTDFNTEWADPEGGQTIQVSSLPEASSTEEGNIYQFVGATSGGLTNGYFYKCVEDTTPGTYKWINVNVQAGSGGIPSGGNTNQILKKRSETDYDVEWADPSSSSQVQSDWAETDDSEVSYIQHKPENLVQDANYVHTDNNYDSTAKGIVDGVTAALADKVDKVSGKGLSTNDYTNNDQTALQTTIPGQISSLRTDVDSKAPQSTTYTKTEVDQLLTALKNGRFEVVSSLPVTDIDKTTIYLVPNATHATTNYYDEYICLDDSTSPATWELIGSTQIDLSNYIQKSQTAGLVKNDGSIDQNQYLTQHQDISGKADKVSNPTNGNFVALDSNGNITDSGHKPSDYLTQHQSLDNYYSTTDTAETDLDDADKVPFYDDSATAKKSTTWSNIKAKLKTYFDGLYSTVRTSLAKVSGGTDLSLVTTGEKYNYDFQNIKRKRYIVDGSDASTPIGSTGIGTWYDGDINNIDPSTDEDDWIEISDLSGILSQNTVDVSLVYDPLLCGGSVGLGGYIIDDTTCKICIKFANSISTPSTALVGIDISWQRNEVSVIGD